MKYSNGLYTHYVSTDPIISYDCRHIVSINKFPDNCPREKQHQYSGANQGTEEWIKCVERIIMKQTYNEKYGFVEYEYSATIKQEVKDWLNENIPNSTDKRRADLPQGWMIGDPMNFQYTIDVEIFFLRKVDAMAFRLRWE